jgi:hypothetical protein
MGVTFAEVDFRKFLNFEEVVALVFLGAFVFAAAALLVLTPF